MTISPSRLRAVIARAVALVFAGMSHDARAQDTTQAEFGMRPARLYVAEFAESGDTSRVTGVGNLFAGTVALEAAGLHATHVVRVRTPPACLSSRGDGQAPADESFSPGDYAISGRVQTDSSVVRVTYIISKCEEPRERVLIRDDTASFTWSDASAGMSSVAGYIVRMVAQDLATVRISIRPIELGDPEEEHLFQAIAQSIAVESEGMGFRVVPVDSPADYRVRWRVGREVGGRRSIRVTIEHLQGIVRSDTLLDVIETESAHAGTIPVAQRTVDYVAGDAERRGRLRGGRRRSQESGRVSWWGVSLVSRDDLLRLMAEEYTFITRPVIVRDDRATAGFSAKRVDELVG